jgi:hypothetical protein
MGNPIVSTGCDLEFFFSSLLAAHQDAVFSLVCCEDGIRGCTSGREHLLDTCCTRRPDGGI